MLLRQNIQYRIVSDVMDKATTRDFIRDGTRLVARIKTRREVQPGDRLKFKDGVAELAAADDMGSADTEIIEVVKTEPPFRFWVDAVLSPTHGSKTFSTKEVLC